MTWLPPSVCVQLGKLSENVARRRGVVGALAEALADDPIVAVPAAVAWR